MVTAFCLNAQVTQINSNKSLYTDFLLNSNKAIAVSDLDSTLWATDATLSGTIQLSPTIKFEDYGGILSGKLIFRGTTSTTGSEIYITDGTPGGTVLVKDIYAGATSSAPGDFTLLNSVIYFSAKTAAEGRELWRTDGTLGGTTLLKDIVAGADSSNNINQYHLYSNGTYLLFAARTPSTGLELWKSDGTTLGTVLLKDINTGNAGADSSNPKNFFTYGTKVLFVATDATHGEEVWETDGTTVGTVLLKDINTGNSGADSSKPRSFFLLNNSIVLFIATDATHGEEVWKTDGTSGGTVLLKDINPGTGNSTTFELIPGFQFPVFFSFHTFNNRVYFNAYDGTSTGEVWVTDGTSVNTTLLKDIVTSSTSTSFVLLLNSINLTNKFIFPVSDGTSRSELWESDGTPSGTKLFKAFSPISPGDMPLIFTSYGYDISTGTLTYPLFQGNKFFFKAGTSAEGDELWVSDGADSTVSHTHIVKDINPGTGNGINSYSFLYTTVALFFSANDGSHGNELWKTDGTSGGTSIVYDINPSAADADPLLSLICNGKIIFSATNGDSVATDLYVVDGNFTALPVKITDFTVIPKINDALLQWATSQEINSKNFTIQRSFDAQHFEDIGTVLASGTSYNRHAYSFIDPGIINSGRSILYYRLLSSDIDGKSAYSNIIYLKLNGNKQWNVMLLSNPVQDNVNVMLNGISGNVQLSVGDINGKIIYTNTWQNINGQISLPVKLNHGMYVLIAETNNERKIIKFIK